MANYAGAHVRAFRNEAMRCGAWPWHGCVVHTIARAWRHRAVAATGNQRLRQRAVGYRQATGHRAQSSTWGTVRARSRMQAYNVSPISAAHHQRSTDKRDLSKINDTQPRGGQMFVRVCVLILVLDLTSQRRSERRGNALFAGWFHHGGCVVCFSPAPCVERFVWSCCLLEMKTGLGRRSNRARGVNVNQTLHVVRRRDMMMLEQSTVGVAAVSSDAPQ